MSGGNHIKRGRLVYCCVWLGLFPPSGFKKAAEASGASNPELHKWADLPTAMSAWAQGISESLGGLPRAGVCVVGGGGTCVFLGGGPGEWTGAPHGRAGKYQKPGHQCSQ